MTVTSFGIGWVTQIRKPKIRTESKDVLSVDRANALCPSIETLLSSTELSSQRLSARFCSSRSRQEKVAMRRLRTTPYSGK